MLDRCYFTGRNIIMQDIEYDVLVYVSLDSMQSAEIILETDLEG